MSTLFGFAQDQQDYKYKIIETITVEDEKLTFGKPYQFQTIRGN